jgi:rsbT antagonist protein RsbS
VDQGPALVSILRQGQYLIASIHTALDDSQIVRFQQDLIQQIGQHRSRGVIIDVAALDVLDSFGSRTLRSLGEMARLRGALTVIVGIQPDVAFTMVQLGMDTGSVVTALDLEEGLDYLNGHLSETSWSTGGQVTRRQSIRWIGCDLTTAPRSLATSATERKVRFIVVTSSGGRRCRGG